MDLSSTQRPRIGRGRLLLAAATAVSTILFAHYGSSISNNYHASSTAPKEKGNHIILQPQEQENQVESQQQQPRRLDECYEAENNWHLAMKGKNTCSNDQNFPNAWLNPSMSRFFQSTCEACCEAMFPKLSPDLCVCQDYCGEEEEEESCTGTCCDRYWHPEVSASLPFTCTNTYSEDGSSYPSYWNDNPLMVGTSMFETADGCCDQLTNGNVANCNIVEAEDCKSDGGDESGSGGTVEVPPTPKPTPPTPKPTPPTPKPTPPTPKPTPPLPKPTPPTPRPTLLITIPPHLLQSSVETPRPTLLLTIPPHLVKPVGGTPRPTLQLTIPPQLLNPPTKPPTKPPQQVVGQQTSPAQDACSRWRRRRGCIRRSICEWVGKCRTAASSSSGNDSSSVNDVSSTTETETETTAVCTDGFKWHRGKPSEGSKCTNDLDYPRAWDDPRHTDTYLFDSPEKCCLANFPSEACTVINACGEEQTLGLSTTSAISATSPISAKTVAIPSSSSSNCAGKRRIPCKSDPNCNWRRAPHRKCVAA